MVVTFNPKELTMNSVIERLAEHFGSLSWKGAVLLAAVVGAGVTLGYVVVGPALFG